MVEEKRIVSIPYPSEEWSRVMTNANRADKEFMPLRFKGKSLAELKKFREQLDRRK